MRRIALLAAAALAALVVSGCSGSSSSSSGSVTVPSPRQLTDLRDIDQLRALFNSASGEPRLIVLVSPT